MARIVGTAAAAINAQPIMSQIVTRFIFLPPPGSFQMLIITREQLHRILLITIGVIPVDRE
jgi:hypothetical protein